MLKKPLALSVVCLASLAVVPSAPAHMTPGISASIVGPVRWDDLMSEVNGRIRITNRLPRSGRPWDNIACRFAIFDRRGRDISTGRVIGQHWDALTRVPRGRSKVTRFRVVWEYGRTPVRLKLRHCHRPGLLN